MMKNRPNKPKVQLIMHVVYRGLLSERVFVQPAILNEKTENAKRAA